MDAEQPEDLFDVVDTIARLLGGPVVVEDVDFRVLAYSAVPGQPNDEARRSAILNRRTPDRWLHWMAESGIREQLLKSDELVMLDIPWATFLPRYIQPIRTSDQLVGYLWLMKGDAELAADSARTAREFAQMLAPELARRSRALTENPGGQVLRQFLGGGLPVNRAASILGVEENAATVVVTFETEASKSDEIVVRSRAVRALALYTQIHLTSSLVGAVEQQIYLLHAAATIDESDVATILSATVKHLERAVHTKVRAAAGGVHLGLAAAEASRREADLTLRVVRTKDGSRRTGMFTAMRHEIVLNEIVDALRAQPILVQGMLDRLIAHDRQHNSNYVATLEVYLKSFGDMRWAAEQLHLHPNSLRYRVKRLAEIGGFDLSDPTLRVVLQLLLEA